MTTPPDFGGREFEKGLQEDLGLRPAEQEAEDDPDLAPLADNEAHAPGRKCARCGREIQAGEDVRRRADGQWVHEECPVTFLGEAVVAE
jgi:hypothetical protein